MAQDSSKEILKRYIPQSLFRLRARYFYWNNQRAHRKKGPIILQSRTGSTFSSNHTAVIVCGPLFDQRVPNSMTKFRVGLANGFEEEGIHCEFLSFHELDRLREFPDPIVFCQECDFEFFSSRHINELRRYKHFVWVDPWFEDIEQYTEQFGFLGMSLSDKTKRKVLKSEPAFVFTIAPEMGLEHYVGWERRGVRLISLPLACDSRLYDISSASPKYQDVKIAFVGGYWPYKAQSFDLYLKPYERLLTVFGYWRWPYAGYGGELNELDEPLLYRDAALSPAINEPHVPVMNIDINERVFKVLGSGGLCVTDVTGAYKQLFTKEELLIPESIGEYRDIVETALRSPESLDDYRERGYRAVRQRHTYRHRAQKLIEMLNVPKPVHQENSAA